MFDQFTLKRFRRHKYGLPRTKEGRNVSLESALILIFWTHMGILSEHHSRPPSEGP